MLSYEVTKKDIIQAFKASKNGSYTLKFFLFFSWMLLFSISNMLYIFPPTRKSSYYTFALLIIIPIIKFLNVIPLIRYYISIKSYGINPRLISHHNFILNIASFSLLYGNLCFEIPYSFITNIVHHKKYIIIYLGINIFEIIPLSAFDSKYAIENFINNIKNKIENTKKEQNHIDEDLDIEDGYKYCLKFTSGENELMEYFFKGNKETIKSRCYWSIGRISLILISILLVIFGIWNLISIRSYHTSREIIIKLILGLGPTFLGISLNLDLMLLFRGFHDKLIKEQLKNPMNRKILLGNQAVCVDEDKISSYKKGARFDYQRDFICRIITDKDNFYMILKNKTFLSIPISLFNSSSDVNEFIEYLSNKGS